MYFSVHCRSAVAGYFDNLGPRLYTAFLERGLLLHRLASYTSALAFDSLLTRPRALRYGNRPNRSRVDEPNRFAGVGKCPVYRLDVRAVGQIVREPQIALAPGYCDFGR